MADWTSVVPFLVSVAAIIFGALTWLESRKQRHLLEIMAKTLPYVSRRRRTTTRKREPKPSDPIPAPMSVAAGVAPIQTRAEERRRLKLQLEREKLEWRKNRDIAKAIGWLVDRVSESEDDYDDA